LPRPKIARAGEPAGLAVRRDRLRRERIDRLLGLTGCLDSGNICDRSSHSENRSMPLARSLGLAAVALAPLWCQTPVSAQTAAPPPTSVITMTSLLVQGYEIKSATVTSKFIGMLLQNGRNVYVCQADPRDFPRLTHCGTVK
jgi:hypothetical protein